MTIKLIVSLLIFFSLLVLLNLSIIGIKTDFYKLKLNKKRKISLKEKKKRIVFNKKNNFLFQFFVEIKEMLKVNNQENKLKLLVFLSLIFAFLGFIIGYLYNNYLLMVVLVVFGAFAPFLYIKMSFINYKKKLNDELEVTLSVITTSYLRTEDIITSIEENLDNVKYPLNKIFNEFITNTKLINSNINLALSDMKTKIDNNLFDEWIDTLIACQDDITIKNILFNTINKFSDTRILELEVQNITRNPITEFILMCLLYIFNLPLLYIMNKDWYFNLIHSNSGKIMIALTSAIMFYSVIRVILLQKQVEY